MHKWTWYNIAVKNSEVSESHMEHSTTELIIQKTWNMIYYAFHIITDDASLITNFITIWKIHPSSNFNKTQFKITNNNNKNM